MKFLRAHLSALYSTLFLLGFAHAAFGNDVEYGAYLASECASCHRAGGDEERQIPSITGLEAETFMAVMRGYKSKELENVAMQTIAGGLDDEQLAALAAYFATLPTE